MAAAALIPLIGSIASGLLGKSGAERAGKKLSDANIAAEHGVLGAAAGATSGLTEAGQSAREQVNQGTEFANNTLQRGFEGQRDNLNPYMDAGRTGINALAEYATHRPNFSFNPSDLEHDPGYQFQLGQGTAAVNNSASARGLLTSGNTLQDLTKFGQGLAGTYYNDAFKRALDTFNTNQNSTLSNLSALSGAGLQASGQFNQASQNNSNQQAGNTLNAGIYGGNSGIDIQKFLGQLNTGAAKTAGDYAVGAAGGSAAGGFGGTNSLLGGLEGVTNSLPAVLKALGIGGAGSGLHV